MPTRPRQKITKRMVDALSAKGKTGAFWDRDLPGFGFRVYGSGRTTYVAQARGPSGSRRVTLGRHGKLSADQARKLAAVAIRRIKAGKDPIETGPDPAPEPTVADLAVRCVESYVKVRCKPHTLRGYRRQFRNHILPPSWAKGPSRPCTRPTSRPFTTRCATVWRPPMRRWACCPGCSP